MRLVRLNPCRQPRTAGELIVWVLARRPSLTSRQLKNAVRNLGRPIGPQGVWKALRSLMDDGQIERVEHGVYRISPRWIADLRRLCDAVEAMQRAHIIYETPVRATGDMIAARPIGRAIEQIRR